MFHLIGDRSRVLLKELGNCLKSHTLIEAVFDLSTVIRCEVFVLSGVWMIGHSWASFLGFFPELIQPQKTCQSKSHRKSHCGSYFGNLLSQDELRGSM